MINQNKFTILFAVGVLAAIILSPISGANADSKLDVPIFVGGDENEDVCGATGEIYKLKEDGDGFLAVRSGPGTNYKKIDELYNGNSVYMCEDRGSWIAVIYSKSNPNGDCGVSTPLRNRSEYLGPCRAGWVHKNFVKLIAG